uniref:DDB1-and CUL4-associated factor 13-like n=1 Tax=Hirondellea gigas TaxID=1518452 RepID=A0A2P2I265_9CRUS
MAAIKKLHVLSRNPDQYMRETNQDIHKFQRNYDPDLHPMQVAREYKLALNATKLERVFAKPFVGALVHGESVSAMARHPEILSCIFSGTYEGQLNLWNTRTRKQLWQVQAHNGHIWSISTDCLGETLYTVGHDKTIKRWSYENISQACDETDVFKGAGAANHLSEPIDTWLCDTVISGLSHHRYNQEFLTCGERVLLWDSSKKVPIRSFDWNSQGSGQSNCSAVAIKFNMIEDKLFAACDADNHLVLYDIRAKDVKKLKMKIRLNDLCWNPMEAFVLTAASEDYNAYTFDIRMMDKAERIICQHQGHTSAITCLDYAPTGREFVTGSFDKTIRIFVTEEGRSRDLYHGKRMHKVTSVMWSSDNKFVYSGSADHNVRIWKSRASEKLGIMSHREKLALDYSNELKTKFQHMPEIKRIARHRHLPRAIIAASKEHYRIRKSHATKEANTRLHSKDGVDRTEGKLVKPVFGLQDEAQQDPEREEKDIKKLEKFAAKVMKKKKMAQEKRHSEEKMKDRTDSKFGRKKFNKKKGGAKRLA